jgi:hypothetical protein
MNGEFLLMWFFLGGYRPNENGVYPPVQDVLGPLLGNPDALTNVRRTAEAEWLGDRRQEAEGVMRLLFSTCCYAAHLLGGPQPVLLPREDLDALNARGATGDAADLVLARSLRRVVREQTAKVQDQRDEEFIARVEEMLARTTSGRVSPNKRYMNTDEIGEWMGLAQKTVRRLFNEGKLVGRKVGNEWRATREQLEGSPYLRKRRREADAALE